MVVKPVGADGGCGGGGGGGVRVTLALARIAEFAVLMTFTVTFCCVEMLPGAV